MKTANPERVADLVDEITRIKNTIAVCRSVTRIPADAPIFDDRGREYKGDRPTLTAEEMSDVMIEALSRRLHKRYTELCTLEKLTVHYLDERKPARPRLRLVKTGDAG
jgi:hypothetical protein